MTWVNGRKLQTGTPVPSKEREEAATQNGQLVVYHMSREEMAQYLRERYGEGIAKMPLPETSKVTKEEYLQLRAQGLTRNQVCNRLKLSPATLYRHLEKWGIKRLPDEEAILREMRASLVQGEPQEAPKASDPEPELKSQPQPVETPPITSLEQQIVSYVLQALVTDIHTIARAKGWHDKRVPLPVHLALIHSEVSEALEADRKGFGAEKVAEELADVVIRVMDTAAAHGLDLPGALLAKMARNKTREYRHGGLKY
jgi:NTP pyrophosphatase (non-canonical NTP hydrolase)